MLAGVVRSVAVGVVVGRGDADVLVVVVRDVAGSVCECGELDGVVAEDTPAAPDACAFKTAYS